MHRTDRALARQAARLSGEIFHKRVISMVPRSIGSVRARLWLASIGSSAARLSGSQLHRKYDREMKM